MKGDSFRTGTEVLITAGPTREPMDPVRYISNASSGSMGIELAQTFKNQGARVTLVIGPTLRKIPRSIKVIPVTTALEMSRQVKKKLPACDVFIAAAAVSDWRFAKIAKTKLKKGSRAALHVRFVKNPDILSEAGRYKKRNKKPLLVGFALETGNLRRAALKKMKDKNLDMIVANSPSSFSSPSIKPLWIERGGRATWFSKMSKKKLSGKIARWIRQKLNES